MKKVNIEIGQAVGHGDVTLLRVDDRKVTGKKRETPILAYGEVTGHSHQITSGQACVFEFDEKTYLNVISDVATLSHEEHEAYELLKGTYEITIQREYEPGGWRKVVD